MPTFITMKHIKEKAIGREKRPLMARWKELTTCEVFTLLEVADLDAITDLLFGIVVTYFILGGKKTWEKHLYK